MKPRKITPKVDLENTPSVGALVYELNNYKKDLVDTKEKAVSDVKEVISLGKEVLIEAESKTREMDEKYSNLSDEVVSVLNDIKSNGLKGDPGENADEEAMEERLLAKIPKLEEIVNQIPIDEIAEKASGMVKPTPASLKIIKEEIQLDKEEIVPMLNEASNLSELELTTKNIKGLEKVLKNLETVKGGYVHGGGDHVRAGANITITDDGNGNKTISAPGGGSGITLKTNGTDNGSQTTLNLKQGSGVTVADDGVGGVTISATGGGTGTVTSVTSANSDATVATTTTTPVITIVSAPKLNTARTIGTLTGDITTAGSTFDGTANNTNATTLATVNSNVGSFGLAGSVAQFVVNAKGLITSAVNVAISITLSQISNFGTGVATALGVNVGTAGSVVVNGGALGTPSSGTLTNATGLPVAGITASTTQALGVGSIELGHATDTTLSRSSAGVLAVEGVVVDTISAANTLTNKTLTTPVINGTITGTGQATAATASTITMRDSNGAINVKTANVGFTSTATAGATTTLTVASTEIQVFTGSSSQTVVLPVVTTLANGQKFRIINNSSAGTIAVQSSGANLLLTLAVATEGVFTVVNTAGGTGTASWDWKTTGFTNYTGTGGTVVLSTSPTLVTPALGTPTAINLTNGTALPVSGITSSTSTALGVGSLELGHATDTTLSRSSAGVLAVEGVVIPSISSTNTITNKRPQPRTASSTTASTLTPDLSSANVYYRTTQTATLTINAPTGTPVIGETIAIYVDSAGAQTLTMDTTYKVFGAAFPATTTAGKTLMITSQFNGTDWKTLWANAI